jgi:tetratricopeptide (TPR) repeat protein
MPEKTINQLPPELRRLYTKAAEAAQRENPEYAIALFCQVLEKEPGLYEGRKALRAAQSAKAAGTSTGFFKKMMSGAGASPQIAKAKLALGKNPAEAIAIAEQVLNGDPNNSFAHRIIVDAALSLDLPQTAALSLEVLVKNSPKDKTLVIEFANHVAGTGGNGNAALAEKFLAELIRNNPYDPDLVQAQKNLSAHRTMDEGGYGALAGGKGSFRDVLRNKEEAVSLEQEKRVQKTEDVAVRLIDEYEARLQKEPDNLKMMRSLAELYTQKNQFARALELYGRIQQSDVGGGDASLDRAITDTTVRQFDFQIAQLNPFDAESAEKIAAINSEKLNFQMEDCRKRVEKYPTDLAIRFEMGVLYFQSGKFSEAVQEFQKAQGNPHKRLSAMSYLAQCFAKRKMYDLAADKLQDAIKEKPSMDDEKKDLVYNLGCVYEAMGKKQEAFEQFKTIFKDDGGYKDVSAKVEAYYAAQ